MKNRRSFKYFPEQLREDLTITAIEGGCNYWAEIDYNESFRNVMALTDKSKAFSERVFEAINRNDASFTIVDSYGDDGVLGRFDKDGILKGEVLMHKNHYEHWRNAISDNWDAETADVWFQLCIMGKLVYG